MKHARESDLEMQVVEVLFFGDEWSFLQAMAARDGRTWEEQLHYWIDLIYLQESRRAGPDAPILREW